MKIIVVVEAVKVEAKADTKEIKKTTKTLNLLVKNSQRAQMKILITNKNAIIISGTNMLIKKNSIMRLIIMKKDLTKNEVITKRLEEVVVSTKVRENVLKLTMKNTE